MRMTSAFVSGRHAAFFSPIAGSPAAAAVIRVLAVLIFALVFLPLPAVLAQESLPVYLQDRGRGIPTSMFGILACNY